MKREFLDYLCDMLHNAQKALTFAEGLRWEDFEQDEKTQYAVIRALEILGEAAKKVPEEVKSLYPEIPWRAIAGMRDKLIHDYVGINVMVIWRTIQEDLPPLIPQLKRILRDYGELIE